MYFFLIVLYSLALPDSSHTVNEVRMVEWLIWDTAPQTTRHYRKVDLFICVLT